jgi:hypothetical protein
MSNINTVTILKGVKKIELVERVVGVWYKVKVRKFK